jgi:hypothetical protein
VNLGRHLLAQGNIAERGREASIRRSCSSARMAAASAAPIDAWFQVEMAAASRRGSVSSSISR